VSDGKFPPSIYFFLNLNFVSSNSKININSVNNNIANDTGNRRKQIHSLLIQHQYLGLKAYTVKNERVKMRRLTSFIDSFKVSKGTEINN